MPNITANLTLTADQKYNYTKSYTYKDGFIVRQEVDSTDTFTKLMVFDVTKGAQTIQGFKTLVITNAGQTAAEIQIGNYSWTAGSPDTDGTTLSYHTFLLTPGEFFFIPNPRFIDYSAASSAGGGSTLDNQAPALGNTYVAVDSQLLAEALDATETDVDVDDGDYFEVGDYIRIEDETMEVTAIATNTLTVIRGSQGSTAATHADNTALRFPFSNIDHDYDDTSKNGNGDGTTLMVKTNGNGDYHAMNILGYGRTATKKASGFVPGSISFKYYTEGGYQNFGMKNQSLASETGLAKSTAYTLSVNLDGAGATDYSFTTDSSDVTWGNTSNGVLYKIQTAFDDARADMTITIVNGDIQVKSNTNNSSTAIALADGGAGTTPFGVGALPTAANLTSAVVSSLPDDTMTDKKTGITSPNRADMLYDNGDGTLSRPTGGSGTINYKTGEITMKSCPKNAQFVVSAAYDSAHAGGLKSDSTAGYNMIKFITGRSVSNKLDTIVEIRGYN